MTCSKYERMIIIKDELCDKKNGHFEYLFQKWPMMYIYGMKI